MMRMLRNNLLVKQLEKEQLGKLVMPDSVVDEWYRGLVVSVGPGLSTAPTLGSSVDTESQIKVGEVVIYPPPFRGAYPTIVVDGQGLIILPEDTVWAVE